jgi:iron(III) transport system permease protein
MMPIAIDSGAGLSRPPATAWPSKAFQTAVTAMVAFLILLPLLPLVVQAFIDKPLYEAAPSFTLDGFRRLLTSSDFWMVLWNTVRFALGATLIAQFFGIAGTILIARTNLPGRRFAGSVFIWPLFVSHLVLAFGWIVGFGPSGFISGFAAQLFGGEVPWNLYSLTGLSIAAGTSLAPLTYLYCMSSVKTIDPSLESAARISGCGPLKSMWRITLPLLKPAIWSSATLNFVLAIELLALPLLLGGPVGLQFLTTFLYAQGIEANNPDYSIVAACALLMIGLISLLIVWQTRSMGDSRRYVTVGGKATRQRLLDLGAWRWPLFILVNLYLAVTVWCVLGAVILRSFTTVFSPFIPLAELLTLDNYRALIEFPQYVRSITNTVLVAIGGGAIGTVLVAATALVSIRSDWFLRKPLQFIALYPRAVPGLLIGIGVFWAVAWVPGLKFMQNTIWILMFALLMRHFPTGLGAVTPSVLQISQDLDNSARVSGATWLTTAWRIILPQLRTSLAACYILMVVHFIKEYASVVFLFGPGSEMLGTTMLTFWVQGEQGAVAALAVLQIALIVAFLGLFRLIFKVKLYG